MRIRLNAAGQARSYDTQLGRFTDAEAIPCFRCGVCCQRWTPLIGRAEAERLARFLGVELEAFLARYTRPYPLSEDEHQLKHDEGGCVFLRWEAGMAACAVHEARPQACRDWDASLRRRECLDGLLVTQIASCDLVLAPQYVDPAEAEAFHRHLRAEPGLVQSTACPPTPNPFGPAETAATAPAGSEGS